MNTATKYRCRQTGLTLTAAAIPDRARVTRYLPPKVKQHGKLIQPTIQLIWPPADEKDYDQYLFDVADIDPILPASKPVYDAFSQSLVEGDATELAGEWFETWEVVENFATLEELRVACIGRVNERARTKRDGGIVVDGVPIRTDTVGIARITGAKLAAQATSDFVVGDETFELPLAKVEAIFTAVNEHVQGTYSDRAKLIKAIKVSSDPLTVDLSALD